MQEMQETQDWSLDREEPLEQEMAAHSSILAWEVTWAEEPGGYSPWDCNQKWLMTEHML